ncbi:sigma-70 family RNA polymerase sigma factor [Oceanibacterium hippocampi]|uniref:ECF RNA polymerase sigma factor SigJ n=1 Tax=Oceanibacterium hippocampi TaxID=745714 RepID=A0A1Y5TX77_9PROT|nr:sigma-70 family RNA polymerase sigma factor [Oceanibacterium hippocampi]SLN75975.1 ECF RNA polymerase sigma factor SigJ [Oceanibacterium hippocampi]
MGEAAQGEALRPDSPALAAFERHRGYLRHVAYRMLGSLADAEDVLQDAYLRWHHADREAVRNEKGYLSSVVTRLCLDHLGSARVRREQYVGAWLPEPLIDSADDADGPDASVEFGYALMLALERLSPLERAAFLLHDIFDMSFTEVARSIGRDEAACRQLALRARRHVRESRPRFPVPAAEGRAIAEAYFRASRDGDIASLESLLAEHAVMVHDGGGRKPAALNPIRGRDRVLRFKQGIARKQGRTPSRLLHLGPVDGLPGLVTMEHGETLQATALVIEEGRIVAIYVIRNPDKLAHIDMPGARA